ncbi:MAG: penicillin acylase family protein [Planctomycetota bacterium]
MRSSGIVRRHWRSLLSLAWVLLGAAAPSDAFGASSPESLAKSVTIVRDEWGVPHIHGKTDEATIFGFAYCQGQDYFWQVEENVLRALGRTAEANGPKGLENDLLTLNFNIPRQAQEDYPKLPDLDKKICEAFSSGLNYFLERNPDVKPRVITRFEPWHIFAHRRQIGLDWMFNKANVKKSDQKAYAESLENAVGSNGWAIGPSRTKNKTAMLFINPHQPWFGPGSWYEGHVQSDEGWNFTGAAFYASPFPMLGHNEHLGWGHTANKPDVADAYRLTFDDPTNPLKYRYADGYREAKERKEVVRVKNGKGLEEKTFVFRDTHLGPVVKKEDDVHFLAVKVAKMHEPEAFSQAMRMTKARNFAEWKEALHDLELPMFNCIYADREGNIAYIYNAAVPRRDPKYTWDQPLDGSDPNTEWNGYHGFAELPQMVNPSTGYVQNCNQSPYFTSDDDNPVRNDFPDYLADDRHVDTRRAKVSRMLLREMKDVSLADWSRAAFDTTMYWPLEILPHYKRGLEELKKSDPELAKKVEPYFEHLFDWDCKGGNDSTQATLCWAWYTELYELKPEGKLQAKYLNDPKARYASIVTAATRLQLLYGDWKVPWGKACRMQRLSDVSVQEDLAFSNKLPSLPCPGAPSELGTVFNTFFLPPTPFRREMYGLAGASYVACIEFGKDKIESKSLLTFGSSGKSGAPHYFDQAALFSKGELKNAWFYKDEVMAHAKATYHPGEERE